MIHLLYWWKFPELHRNAVITTNDVIISLFDENLLWDWEKHFLITQSMKNGWANFDEPIQTIYTQFSPQSSHYLRKLMIICSFNLVTQ